MIAPTWESECGTVKLWLGDCLDVMTNWPDGAVDAVVTDPPYKDVLADSWDRQWKSDSDFLDWCGSVSEVAKRILADNGSLYWFASARMAARVESLIRERFAVLNNIVWCKGLERRGSGWNWR